ncbi:MAG: hypothetical protein ACE5F8_05585 [Woeseiaceae bacterium]
MTDNDEKLAQAVRRGFPADPGEPPFDETWAAAESRYRSPRRRYAGLTAAVAATVLVIFILVPESRSPEIRIDTDELLGSTGWSAPSDVLLPQKEFDIYQDLPTLPVSTKSAEGGLL